VLTLAQLARAQGIGFTIDAEESERLELSLEIIARSTPDPSLDGWEGFGLAVQAYQKRAPFGQIDWLIDLARRTGRRMPVRLVKGAYWDSEIKRAQIDGHRGYPVFTRKPNTDLSYLACAKAHPGARRCVLSACSPPTTRTPSPPSASSRSAQRPVRRPFEFQRLHGMGGGPLRRGDRGRTPERRVPHLRAGRQP
jgi:RHH-type proline utilization regulon transcriptional repressor/proline dehydrogenase/delta 1-pyrroline-5-carboxylate dehydrogenase